MRIRQGKPWFDFLIRLGGMKPGAGAIYTFGTTIYATAGLTADLIVHEQAHMAQQRALGPWIVGPIRWWLRYLTSPSFRMDQEVSAYATQSRYLRDRVPRRVALRCLYEMAATLASPMYALSGVGAGTRKAQPLTDAEAMALIVDHSWAMDRLDGARQNLVSRTRKG